MNTFSAGECIRFGWEAFKKRPWFFILVTAALGGASRVSADASSLVQGESPQLLLLVASVAILGVVVGFFIDMGRTHLLLKAHDNVEQAELNDLWVPRFFWKFVGTYILVVLIFVAGLVLLVIPGIIWGLRYMFACYIVVDRNLKPLEALKESARITDGHKWELLGFVLLLGLVNILGFICLFVGLLVSIPVTALAFVHAYRTLSSRASAA